MKESILKIKTPDSKSPGYLLRLKRLNKYKKFLENPTELSEEELNEVVQFILDFVEEPADRKEAEELLWLASFEEFRMIIASLGGSQEKTVPLAKND